MRGEGLIVGIDLSIDGAPFVDEALRSGLLINCTHEHILRLLPPFIIRREDVAEFLAKFEMVCLDSKSATKLGSRPKTQNRKRSRIALAAAR